MSDDYLFRNVNPEVDVEGSEFIRIIRENHRSMPRYKRSYRTANGTTVEVSFGTGKNEGECSIHFWYRSWRWVNSHFRLERH